MSIAMLAPAKAASRSIPPEYRGQWCQTTGHPYLTQRKHVPPEECDVMINLTATLLQSEEGAPCKLTRIKSVVVDKVNLPEGVFSCPDLNHELRFVFTTGSGSLGYKARRLYLGDDAF
jgi:hypothetical protein